MKTDRTEFSERIAAKRATIEKGVRLNGDGAGGGVMLDKQIARSPQPSSLSAIKARLEKIREDIGKC